MNFNLQKELKRPLRLLDLGKVRELTVPVTNFDVVIMQVADLSGLSRTLTEMAQNNQICLIQTHEQNSFVLLFESFTYIEKISTEPTWYFCSNTYWYANGEISAFISSADPSDYIPGQKDFGQTHRKNRRYYFTENFFLKRYQGDLGESQKQECRNEINFLNNYPGALPCMPKILQAHIEDSEMWFLRERVRGTLLTDIISKKIAYNPRKIITDLLTQLVKLESLSLYQTDLKSWNIVINDDHDALLIDYGAIKNTTQDISPGRHVFFSFLALSHEVLTGELKHYKPLEPATLNVKNYPADYQPWIRSILLTPFSKWSFQFFSDCFYSQSISDSPVTPQGLEKIHQWLVKAELRFIYFKLFPEMPRRFRHFRRLKEMLKFNLRTRRIRYFERRFFKYFEKNFIKKQKSVIAKSAATRQSSPQ